MNIEAVGQVFLFAFTLLIASFSCCCCLGLHILRDKTHDPNGLTKGQETRLKFIKERQVKAEGAE